LHHHVLQGERRKDVFLGDLELRVNGYVNVRIDGEWPRVWPTARVSITGPVTAQKSGGELGVGQGGSALLRENNGLAREGAGSVFV